MDEENLHAGGCYRVVDQRVGLQRELRFQSAGGKGI